MKNMLVSGLYVLVMLLLNGCSKSDNNKNCSAVNLVAPSSEVAALKSFLDSNHIDATADPRGFYYKIIDGGSGNHPNICSSIVVTYRATLTDGTEVDNGTDVTWDLYTLIIGWQEAIPLIAKGGSIMLYLPPSLAYGSSGANNIPPNSILMFNIHLTSIY